jgi:hypothetical protein
MGADFMDYLIADKAVLPFDRQPFYAEKSFICRIAISPMTGRGHRTLRDATEAGPPEAGLVFVASITTTRSTRPCPMCGMRIPAEVLSVWLVVGQCRCGSQPQLGSAGARVAPTRLVFADWVKLDAHLARYRPADLFLIRSHNAHTIYERCPVGRAFRPDVPGRDVRGRWRQACCRRSAFLSCDGWLGGLSSALRLAMDASARRAFGGSSSGKSADPPAVRHRSPLRPY